jgi:hypothetical protein
MSFTIITRHNDGSVSREYHKFPLCPPTTGQSARDRRQSLHEALALTRKHLRDPRGYDRKKRARLVARVPAEVYAHVARNEGAEAAGDMKYLIRKSRELGFDPVVSKGRF